MKKCETHEHAAFAYEKAKKKVLFAIMHCQVHMEQNTVVNWNHSETYGVAQHSLVITITYI